MGYRVGIAFVASVALALCGCGSSNSESGAPMSAETVPEVNTPPATAADYQKSIENSDMPEDVKRIKMGSMGQNPAGAK